MCNGTMFVDLDWPLNASSLLSASAELLVTVKMPLAAPQLNSSKGSLTSRGCLWCLAYNILGESKHALRPSGPARVWASMRDESAAVAELIRRRNLWKRSRNCMPVGEFLNNKTMLTKILLTYTTKLNVAFFGLMRLTN